jgi:hypothetical protein
MEYQKVALVKFLNSIKDFNEIGFLYSFNAAIKKFEELDVDTHYKSGKNNSEEPANTPEEPANTPEEPANTPEEPANTSEEPANTSEEPANTSEEPANTSEEHANTSEEHANTSEEHANTSDGPNNPLTNYAGIKNGNKKNVSQSKGIGSINNRNKRSRVRNLYSRATSYVTSKLRTTPNNRDNVLYAQRGYSHPVSKKSIKQRASNAYEGVRKYFRPHDNTEYSGTRH